MFSVSFSLTVSRKLTWLKAYQKQRKHCVELKRESKIKYLGNFNVKTSQATEILKNRGPRFPSKKPINEVRYYGRTIDQ